MKFLTEIMLADSSSSNFRNCYDLNSNASVSNNARNMDNLFEFLKEAQLDHYFEDLNVKLKVRFTAQLKYVDETDLTTIGMTRPEMRRLKKYFEKEFPQTAMGKIKKRLSRNSSNRSTSVPRPQDLSGKNNYFSVKMNGNGLSVSPIGSDDLTTVASITNSSITSNGAVDSYDLRQFGTKHLILQNQLTIGSLLKHGEFADVYQATYRSGQSQIQVFMKSINKVHLKNDLNEFIKEVFVLCYLDHPHLVKLHGISLDDQNIKLITEQINVNSLIKCLQEANAKTLYSVLILHNFNLQISEALAYLEDKRVIHGNLTSQNVYLFPDNQIKISDAGLFRSYSTFERNDVSDHGNWMAPEINNGFSPTLSSDVWAFGVLLWEIYNYGQYPSMTKESIGSQVDLKLPFLSQPDLCPNMIFNVITTCWNEQPRERPTFFQLSSQFVRLVPEQLIAMVNGPDQIPSHRSEDVNEPSDGSYSSLTDLQMLCYKKGDIIIVLDRSMCLYKDFWRGCLLNGESGYFKWCNMRAIGASQSIINNDSVNVTRSNTQRVSISPTCSVRSSGRSRSVGETFAKLKIIGRESDKKPKHGRISIDMISAPQNDFRHVGHVSNNGHVFGDVTSLYTSTAQQKIRSGTLSVSSKIDVLTDVSGASSVISSSTLNATGDDTPPYATIDNETSKSHSDKNMSKPNISIPPPLPPTRSSTEDETPSSLLMDDFLTSTEFSLCNDGFSLFNELSKQWDMQYSGLEVETTPVSENKIHVSETKLSIDSESPTVVTNNSSMESSICINDRSATVSSLDKSKSLTDSSSCNPSCNSQVQKPALANNAVRSSSFFTKIRTLGSGIVSKTKEASSPTESVANNSSPLYAKIKKSNKPKKQKETNSKKNIISHPILITAPIITPTNLTEENYLDCSSEVSSLQPSPRESLIGITNHISMNMSTHTDQGPLSQTRQFSYYSKSKTNGSTTSVSPASSFVSLTSTPATNITQGGGAAMRAIKKGDGVFRATAVNALNRRRPSATDQISNDGTLSRARQPSLPLMSTISRMNSTTTDRRQYQRATLSNNELLESVLDSSATTPIASELPDLPYIDLSFARQPVEDKTNTGDEDDAYNSLHSGSVGSDTTEFQVFSKPVDSKYDRQSCHSPTKENLLSQSFNKNSQKSNLSFFQTDKFARNPSSDLSYNNFQMKSQTFASYGDNDEIAL